jgi:tRNA threonylcarbamoyladenosine biosynthesis protein TsaE
MPILDSHTVEFISRNPGQTRRVGMRLGGLLKTGDVICLHGDLGSGKTTLVQGMCAGWGSLDRATSPTFVLVNVYRRADGSQLFHMDAYRLANSTEATDLDITNLSDHGPLIIEWAERIKQALPQDHLWISMSWVDENQRDMVLSSFGSRYQILLYEFRKSVYGVA